MRLACSNGFEGKEDDKYIRLGRKSIVLGKTAISAQFFALKLNQKNLFIRVLIYFKYDSLKFFVVLING